MYIPGLVYDEAAPYDTWVKYVIYGIPLLLVVIGIWLITVDPTGTIVMIADAALIGLIFYFVMPRRYRIYEDRITIMLGGPIKISVPFAGIAELRAAEGYKSSFYGGMRFATTSRNVVEIIRRKGLNIVISPANRDMFLEQYQLARQAYDKLTHTS